MKNMIVDINDLTDSRELMEKKAPRSITIFIGIILAIILTLLVWSSVGEIDEYSKVSGEIRPRSSTNIISVSNGGKIKSLNFQDGDIVEAGDIILTLDVISTENQKNLLTDNIDECNKKIKYNNQLKECIEKGKNSFNKTESEIEYFNQYEKYVSDLKISVDQISDTNNQNINAKQEAEITLQSIEENINENNLLIQEYNNIITAVENNLTFVSSNNTMISYYNNYIHSITDIDNQITEIESNYENLKNQLGNGVTQTQVDEAELKLDSLTKQKESLKNSFVLEVNQKIDSLYSEVNSLEASKDKTNLSIKGFSSSTTEEQVKDQAKLNMIVSIDNTISTLESAINESEMQLITLNDTIDNSKIVSEVSGQIVYYSELSVGNTLQGGTQIAKIIPTNNELRTVMYIPSTYISDIKVGQQIQYTVSSISSTDFGKIYGKITSVSADSFVDDSSGTVYYKAEGTLESASLTNSVGETKYLKSGMTVEAHVISGSKKIIVWFLEQLNFID